MNKIRAFIERQYYSITTSIAFWPSLLAVGFMLLAIVMRSVSTEAVVRAADKVVPFLLIQDRDVSLSLLTTLIGGLISLMVFSFSMVMVLLSNATANLSPRLLPSLVGSREHQVVLGFYLGTILFDIIIAMGFGLSDSSEKPPSISIALAVIFGIICLVLFVTFIHNVSQSIQVGLVLSDVHSRTLLAIDSIKDRKDNISPSEPPGFENWPIVRSPVSGFLQSIDSSSIKKFVEKNDVRIVITAIRGKHVMNGDEIGRISNSKILEKEESKIHSLLIFGRTERTSMYYAHGIERISEVAIKALSPGINDPATALTSIDYLKHIFAKTISLEGWEVIGVNDNPSVWFRLESWESLLSRQFESIFAYGHGDQSIRDRLELMLEALYKRVDSTDLIKMQTIRSLRNRLAEEKNIFS